MILLALGGLLLILFGTLLGATWSNQFNHTQLRRQAAERRRLNEEWVAIRTIRQEQSECPRCGYALSGQNWYFIPTAVEERPDDDCTVVGFIG
jgi:hypothetical protein